MRRLLTLLLATFAIGSASAAQVVYEFRAVVGDHTDSFGGSVFPSMTLGRQVVGTLTLDPARTVDGAIAPVVALTLATVDGGQVFFDSAGHSVTSQMETRAADGVESVLINARFDHERQTTEIELSWASPGQGQLPADPRNLNILALKPYGWKVEINGFEAFPCDSVHCRTSRTNSQIFSFKRAAAAAEYEQRFTSTTPRWIDSGGDWTTQSGFYANAANVAFTSSVYTGQTLQPFAEVRADLYSGLAGSGNALGLVLNYRNASNFYEVRFTGNGVVTINKVVNGTRTMLRTGSYSAPPQTFFHVSVLRDFEAIEVRVNNAQPIVAEDSTLMDGEAGIFASFNNARVDNFAIDQLSPWGVGFQTQFWPSDPNPFRARTGTWAAAAGPSYQNTSNQAAAISTGGFSPGGDFVLFARLNGQWSGAGNRGGLVWDFRDSRNYSAVLLSPRTADRAGRVEIIEVVAGVRRVLASSSDGSLPVGFFGLVSVSRVDGVVRVRAPGMTAPYLTVAQTLRGGDIGLIASWNLVRFDDVVFRSQSGRF